MLLCIKKTPNPMHASQYIIKKTNIEPLSDVLILNGTTVFLEMFNLPP